MGRIKTKSRSTRLTHSTAPEAPPHATLPISPKGKKSKTKAKPAPTVEALLAKAQELVVQCEYDLARQFVDRVLDREGEGENAGARELKGVVEMESGDPDKAKDIFLTLVPPSATAPDPAPPSAHLYLGQLFSDDDPRTALGHYQTAVEALVGKLAEMGKGKETAEVLDEEEEEVRRMVVRACCSMVDIWMTDLCFEPEAESSCEEILRQALSTDPDNTEALLSLASVRMSQQRPDEAEQCVRKVWSMWEEIAAGSYFPLVHADSYI